jgi:hypothetical protein
MRKGVRGQGFVKGPAGFQLTLPQASGGRMFISAQSYFHQNRPSSASLS